MPGKQKRDGSKPLTRQQAKVAGNILRPHFDPSRGEKQFNEKTKRELVRAVNEKFAQDGQDAVYTVRKLEDWVRATRCHRGRALAAAHARLTTARAGLQRDLQVAQSRPAAAAAELGQAAGGGGGGRRACPAPRHEEARARAQ